MKTAVNAHPPLYHQPNIPGRRLAVALLLSAGLSLGGGRLAAMPSAPPDVTETGAPSFVVLGPEALGLSTAPIDLHRLPDGRILVVSQHELAFGDGVRWETFRRADDQPLVSASVAVDADGQIYTGIDGGFARIVLGEGASWHLTPVVELPKVPGILSTTLITVAAFPDDWYWYGGNGSIVSWRPGRTARISGNLGSVQRIFPLGKEVYVSDQSSGGLYRLATGGAMEKVPAADNLVSDSVTCAVPFAPGQLLVGTGSVGLKLFDGIKFRPFGPTGLVDQGHRITDLCAAGDGYFAAAVDSVGIVCFDREGRTVQTLERALDHRLARVQRLLYTPEGVLWALLLDGVARVQFPSPVSDFVPLLPGGITFAQPLRHDGRLWMLADGRAMRGIYDEGNRLERFEDDTPTGRFLYTLADIDGQLFGSNNEGIYLYEANRWRLILPGVVNARLGVAHSTKDGIYYVARGEYGTIQRSGRDYRKHSIAAPELGDSYGSLVDAQGIGWLELGTSRVGRFSPDGASPTLQIFGTRDGITEGWVEIYQFDGIARFHLNSHLYRFDEAQHRFVEDRELLARFPRFAAAAGRPVTDRLGRMWHSDNGTAQVIDRSATGGDRPVRLPPVGFAPTIYTAEDDGVVWMFEKRRLARVDLRLPAPPDTPLRALITSVQFPASSRQLFAPGAGLAPLDYSDNSVVIHYAAPANPFVLPVAFEVLLEGAGSHWVSTGTVGSATFSRLKEGDYVFRVRPVAGGTAIGTEARLQFTVRPPWFRTPLAWVIYVVATVGLFVFVTWYASYLQRRENDRLERLVAERTRELNASNLKLGRQIQETTEKSAALSVSEERFRQLNTGLEARVKQRTAELTEASGLLDAMMENTPDLIYFKDRASRLVRCSRAFTTRFNIADLALVRGKTDFDLFSTEHAQSAYEDEQKIIATGGAMIGKLEKETYADGRITWALTTKMPWRDGTGRIVGTFGISKDVTAWKEAELELAATHKNLVGASRLAGMAEVATGVLHNVGNVLNSLNVSSTLIAARLRQSKADSLTKLAALLHGHNADLREFLTADPKGRRIPELISILAQHLEEDRRQLLAESVSLQHNIDHIKEIVSRQQAYAKVVAIMEPHEPAALMDEALQMNVAALSRHQVQIVRDYQPAPPILVEKGKVLQILINLISNAKYACDEAHLGDGLPKVITMGIAPGDPGFVRLIVQDTGVGIPRENLTLIFGQGFTTRATGHGFGLHSSALAAKDLNGTLIVHSDGAGTGATFILSAPVAGGRETPGVAPAVLETVASPA